MKEIIDNEIIKELEEEIHLIEYVDGCFSDGVSLDLLQNTLALINRQKEEINALNGNTEKYIAECEKRSREIAEDYRKEIKSEAIREFSEKLRNKSELLAPSVYAEPFRAVSVKDIDILVKKMTESEDT